MTVDIIFIAGPTASGKTLVAERLSKLIDAEILSCDSRAIYKELDIGTGKSQNSRDVKYHMTDLIDPGNILPVYKLVNMSRTIIGEILEQGSVPIICGGSHYWMERIIEGMVSTPPPDENLRKHYLDLNKDEKKGYLHDILKEMDPDLASKVHPNNTQRVIRYLEIAEKKEFVEEIPPLEFDHEIYFFERDIRSLRERIVSRTEQMMDSGWMDEVSNLLEAGFERSSPGFDSIGYSRIFNLIDGKCDRSECIDLIISDTVKMARSQRKWKNRLKDTTTIDLDRTSLKEAVDKILSDDQVV